MQLALTTPGTDATVLIGTDHDRPATWTAPACRGLAAALLLAREAEP